MSKTKRLIIIPLFAAAIALAPMPASALTIKIEAEDFVDFYESGLITEIREYLSRLEGLDYPGEWTEYTMNVSAYGTYSFLLLCWGDFGVPYHLQLHLTPILGGDTQTIDINFVGKGCTG